MTTEGIKLASVQLASHIQLDRIYQPLAADVSAIVLRYAVPDVHGISRLSAVSRALIRQALDQRLARAEPEIVTAIIAAIASAEMVADPATTPVIAPLPILGSLQRNRSNVIAQADRLVQRGIALGLTALQAANTVRQFFSPFFAPRRSEMGRLLRASREGAIHSWPGRAGMASSHARMLMLSETTAGHGRAMQRVATRNGEGLRWRVSRGHAERDQCDDNANRDSGMGPGIFLPSDLPPLPSHPRCRCFTERVDISRFLTFSERVPA